MAHICATRRYKLRSRQYKLTLIMNQYAFSTSLESSPRLLQRGEGRLLRSSSRVASLAVARKAICKGFLIFVR